MTTLRVVADASSLIALNDIQLLDRLAPLFSEFLVPARVEREAARSVAFRDWMTQMPTLDHLDQRIVSDNLDPGESEALTIALTLPGHYLLVDELRARRVAARLGVPVIGAIGILIRAKHDGLIASVRDSIEALERSRFFLSTELIETALRASGEL